MSIRLPRGHQERDLFSSWFADFSRSGGGFGGVSRWIILTRLSDNFRASANNRPIWDADRAPLIWRDFLDRYVATLVGPDPDHFEHV